MKKRIWFNIILMVLIISVTPSVNADLVVPGDYFYSYNSVEKLEEFNKYIGSPLKEIVTISLILFIVLGLVLLTFKITNNNESENNFIKILKKAFAGISIAFSLISIYMIKVIGYFGATGAEIHNPGMERFQVFVFIAYIITMFISCIIGIKKKNKKIIYRTIIALAIATLAICCIMYISRKVGYYLDSDYYRLEIN